MPFSSPLAPLEADMLHWGFVSITVPNAIVIATMIVVFVLALVIPFPRHREDRSTR